MAQLTIYLDSETRRQIEKAARTARVSVSRWVKDKLTLALSHDWPEGYFELFGSLSDGDLEPPEELPADADLPRDWL